METRLAPEGSQANPDSSGPRDPDGTLPGQYWELDLLVMARDVPTTLRSLGSGLADSARTAEEQEQTLVELAEAVKAFRVKLPRLTAAQPATAE